MISKCSHGCASGVSTPRQTQVVWQQELGLPYARVSDTRLGSPCPGATEVPKPGICDLGSGSTQGHSSAPVWQRSGRRPGLRAGEHSCLPCPEAGRARTRGVPAQVRCMRSRPTYTGATPGLRQYHVMDGCTCASNGVAPQKTVQTAAHNYSTLYMHCHLRWEFCALASQWQYTLQDVPIKEGH